MSIIRILPAEIANRIAAGEVIERPASVVKELVENSLDAGARRLVIQARHGGKSQIQVSDDGGGMDRDDALLSLEPHATSKIREAADIERICTLGFRGEALPSIASVCHFHLQTRRPEDTAGTEVFVDGGVLREVRDCGCAPGTNIRVGQLFFNLPARRKFLKGTESENEQLQETVLLQALAHPEVAFELSLDQQPVLQVAGGHDRAARVAMLLGRDVFNAMLPVDYEEAGITIMGFVARPGLTRSSRRDQRFFVNGRPAAADALFFGVRDAYHTLVMKGRYPPVVLYVQVPVDRVDVNVHPSKREVRFRDAAILGQIMAAAVRRALRGLAGSVDGVAVQPVLQVPLGLPSARPVGSVSPTAAGTAGTPPPPFQLQRPAEQTSFAFPPTRPSAMPDPGLRTSPPVAPENRAPAPTSDLPAAAPAAESAAATVPESETRRGTSPSSATREEIRQLRVLGTFNKLYLVAESASGLVLIDQHAAHERILFERLLRQAAASDGPKQPLLMPVTVDVSPADAALLRKTLEHFTRLGFAIEAFGGNTFLVTAVPPHFPQQNMVGLLRDILDDLRDTAGTTPRPDEVRIAQAACKHAVKAEDPLAPVEITRLLADLAEAEMPYTCPHGRPVMITLPHGELEKRFGRRV